jgi:hypothetical protein
LNEADVIECNKDELIVENEEDLDIPPAKRFKLNQIYGLTASVVSSTDVISTYLSIPLLSVDKSAFEWWFQNLNTNP